MDELFSYQAEILKTVKLDFVRFLYPRIFWDERIVGIKGPRGSGKTTLLLQKLKTTATGEKASSLYVTIEHPWFLVHSLFETAQEFYRNGGRTLFIDEIHKYKEWSRELKVLYDGFPELKIVFSASSAIEIYKGEADLSRRAIAFELPGMSFREYLNFVHGFMFEPLGLKAIVENHAEHAIFVNNQAPVIKLFREYLKSGYLPMTKFVKQQLYPVYLFNTINTVLEQDLQLTENLTATAVFKLKKLLGILAQSVPFEPNIADIATKAGISRTSVYEFLTLLERARIINFLVRDQFGISALQKPDKIFFENSNLIYAVDPNPNLGTVRETFFLNQMKNSGLKTNFPKAGDFFVDNAYTFEIGGKNKKSKDENLILVKDDIEIGFGKTIPLWLFGFLY